MMITPIKNYVVIEPINEQLTQSGIIIPEIHQDKAIRGTVKAVGTKAANVVVGDVVLFDKYAGTQLKDGEKDILMMKEDNIIAVLEY